MSATIEASPRWVRIMQWFEANGGLEPGGVQVPVGELSAGVGIPARQLRNYTRKMEKLGVLNVRRTTLDGKFGTARAHNIYRLLITSQRWIDEDLGQKISNANHERQQASRSAKARQHNADAPQPRKPVARRVPTPVVLDDDEIEVLAQAYTDTPDDELYGW